MRQQRSAAWIAAACLAVAAQQATAETAPSPYAGEEARTIKALSAADVEGLLAGQGAGYAKAAELNGYPGPMHALELRERLQLDAGQVSATEALMAGHKARARALGVALVQAERRLDALFAKRRAEPAAVDGATREVALLQARLRAEHLNTHLAQTALMSAGQVRQYGVLRGYAEPVIPGTEGGTAPTHQRSHH